MKKLLLLLVLPCVAFGMNKAGMTKGKMADNKMAGHFIKFISMEQSQTQDWMNFKKEKSDAKLDMLKKHKNQLFDLKKEYVQKLAQGLPVETYFQEMLQAWIKLHKQQKEEWKNLCSANRMKGEAIYEKHNAELGNFEKSVGQFVTQPLPTSPLFQEMTAEQSKEMLGGKAIVK
jgi:hypothetical protein